MATEVDRRRADERRTVDRRWAGASRPLSFEERRADERRCAGDRRTPLPARSLRLLPPPQLRPGRAEVLRRLYPAALIALLSSADLVTTRALQSRGGIELNPVGRWLIGHGVLGGAKLLALAAIAVLLPLARPRSWIVNALWFVAGVYAAIITLHVVQLLAI
jgi:hypothetical protein